MRSLRISLCAVALLAVVALPSAASAAKNPYSAARVCGPGYRVIDRQPLYDGNYGRLLATAVLTYNGRTGTNCAVTMKRYRVGKTSRYGDHLYVELATRPLGPNTIDSNQGSFKYYAGPVYVHAPHRCVQWTGGADLIVPANWEPRGTFHSAYKSRWEHCG